MASREERQQVITEASDAVKACPYLRGTGPDCVTRQAHLAEAVGLIQELRDELNYFGTRYDHVVKATNFLAEHERQGS